MVAAARADGAKAERKRIVAALLSIAARASWSEDEREAIKTAAESIRAEATPRTVADEIERAAGGTR